MRSTHRIACLLALVLLPWVASRTSAAPPSTETHWAFVPVRRPAVPEVSDPAWSHNPVDCFLKARMVSEGVEPAPAVDRRTLVRRLFLDLIGLPPTPEEV